MTEDTADHWVRVPTALAEKARISHEKRMERDARYEQTAKAKERRLRYNSGSRAEKRVSDRAERTFIVWDGEQPRDTGYSLFGNSEGMEICHPSLSTEECLQLIIDTEAEFPDAIHVGFGFNFDVSWILKDIGWTRLNRLKKTGRTFWHGYRIQHIPRKWFTVSHGGVTAKIFEVFSFFNKRLTDTLEDWAIGPWGESTKTESSPATNAENGFSRGFRTNAETSQLHSFSVPSLESARNMSERELVETFKWVRSEFLWKDIEAIRIYMRLELKYTKLLMERLRETFVAAGYLPKSWHGPGALAREAFKRHDVYSRKAVCPAPVNYAARCAFIGGRFTPTMVGHFKRPVLSYDMNSAYPYAMTFLPNLARGEWRFTTNPREIRNAMQSDAFALFRIQYHYEGRIEEAEDWEQRVRDIKWKMFPLPRRRNDGGVGWPHRVTSWYWTPEAKLVMNAEEATFVAAWVFDEEDSADRPFSWVPEYYRRRQLLKRTGNAAEYTFKIILNAGFGQCAQRVGWNKETGEPPKTHQLEWAGFITSFCRAAMYDMVRRVGQENVISIDTDGIFTFAEVPMKDGELGDDLGQWKREDYEDMVVWQTGMYGLKKDGEWSKAKTRGIPRGAYSPEDLIKALENGETEIRVKQNKFIGYGMALNGNFKAFNTWTSEPAVFRLGGASALQHRERDCKHVCTGNVHRLQNNLFFWDSTNPDSVPHYLPWADNSQEMIDAKNLGDDITFFDAWNPDASEIWSRDDENSMVAESAQLAR